jgi:outer membrane protein assembly factor BamA
VDSFKRKTVNSKLKRHKARSFLFLLIVLFVFAPITFAQTEGSSEEDRGAESNGPKPEKRKGKSTWETIVSFPGMLLYLPFEIVFEGSGALVSYIDKSKIVYRMNDWLNSDDGRRGVMPVYSARTGGGISFYQRDLFNDGSKLTLQATAGPKQRQRYQASIRGIQLGSTLHSGILARYQFLSDESFFGLGNESLEKNESNYAFRQTSAEITLGFKRNESFSFNAVAGYESDEIQDGKDKRLPTTTDPNLYTEETLPGLTKKLEFSKLQLALHYDGRNHPGHSTGGVELSLGAGVFNEIGNSDFGFWKASLDFSHYINLFYDRVLVLRIAGEITEPLSDKKIPFYYLSEIGRQETVRGFSRGRFRGNDMILGSLEYRYPIWQLLDAVLFADAGKVADDIFDEFNTKDFHVGYGGGIRLWGPGGLITKFEIGKSKDGIRLYLVLNN